MSNILGLKGLSLPTGSNTLIAAYGNDFLNVATGNGYGVGIDPTQNVEFDVFLQCLFFQNYSNRPLTFDGSVWSTKNVARTPIAKYIKRWNSRLYLGYLNILSTAYPSRVWYSDVSTNNALTWGIEYGTNLQTFANNTTVISLNSGFRAYNIKRGDPFIILTGPNAGQYTVAQVSSDQVIQLANLPTQQSPILYSSTNDSFLVGGNFFDNNRDDGDFITGLGENNFYFYPQFLTFKRDSLFRYDGTRNLPVYGAFGTTSGRSITNIHELTLYFYGASGLLTGVYAYDGRESVKISAPIEKHIQGINPNMYNSIVGWREEELARMYVGDILNEDEGIDIPKAVLTYDYNSRAWSVDSIANIITASCQFRQSAISQTFLGTSDNKVILTPSGNDFNGSPIKWSFRTTVYYPNGTTMMNKFTRIQILHDKAEGVQVKYYLHLKPFTSDKEPKGLGSLSTELSEFKLGENVPKAAGISFEFFGIDKQQAEGLIKKIIIFSKADTSVIQ